MATKNVKRAVGAVLCALLALSVTACARGFVTFVDEGRTYDDASIDSLFAKADPGELGSRTADDAPLLRQQALTALRRNGEASTEAARLLTETFPAATAAVPYYVERARYGGRNVWVIIEAQGRPGSVLTGRRLWVLGPEGDVVMSRLR